MDKMKIVGMRECDFTDDRGCHVQGISFFFLMDNDRVVGQVAGKFFLSHQKRGGMDYVPNVGDEVWTYYDRYGKPVRFEKVGK